MKKIFPFVIALLAATAASAQGETGSGDLFRSNLKMYVVVAVLVIIMASIFIFLFNMEKRLKKLEQNPGG